MYYDKEGNEITKELYITHQNDPEYSFINYTVLPDGHIISTIWLGIDLGGGLSEVPLVFETALFFSNESKERKDLEGTDFVEIIGRYSTEKEAEEGHDKLIHEWAHKDEEDNKA